LQKTTAALRLALAASAGERTAKPDQLTFGAAHAHDGLRPLAFFRGETANP
jgi:hypothetical protein